MKIVLKVFLLAGALLVSGQVFAQETFIRSLTYNGTGCSNADATHQLFDTNNDGRYDQFAILFAGYIAEQGSGIPLSQRRKNCNIAVQLRVPAGLQFSIVDVRYLGFADLPKGVEGWQQSAYEFPFFSNSVTLSTRLVGPYSRSYEINDQLPLGSYVWSPCGRDAPMNIRSQVYLKGPSNLPAAMTTDQIDFRVRQVYHLVWRACRPSAAGPQNPPRP